VTKQLPNNIIFFFCVLQKKETRAGLKQLEVE